MGFLSPPSAPDIQPIEQAVVPNDDDELARRRRERERRRVGTEDLRIQPGINTPTDTGVRIE